MIEESAGKKTTRVCPGLNFGFDAFDTGIPKTMAI